MIKNVSAQAHVTSLKQRSELQKICTDEARRPQYNNLFHEVEFITFNVPIKCSLLVNSLGISPLKFRSTEAKNMLLL